MMLGSPSAKYKVGIQAQGLLLFLFVATFLEMFFQELKELRSYRSLRSLRSKPLNFSYLYTFLISAP